MSTIDEAKNFVAILFSELKNQLESAIATKDRLGSPCTGVLMAKTIDKSAPCRSGG